MSLCNRVAPAIMLRIGLVVFALASLARVFIHPTTDFSRGFVDGLLGTLYGASICLLLTYLFIRRRQTTKLCHPDRN